MSPTRIPRQQSKTPIALTIAGSDSGGGAGIQADIKAFSANGVYGASVITAITAQNTRAVTAVHAIPIHVVKAQIDAILGDLDVAAIKIGMLFSPELVSTVAYALDSFQGAIVLDPVMIAKSGDTLLQDEAISALVSELIPRADLITPNLPEAQKLLSKAKLPQGSDSKQDQALALLKLGSANVLLKDGHGQNATCSDLLATADGTLSVFNSPRLDTKNTHGTGCTYSSSIAAWLARGYPMEEAVAKAHRYLSEAIAQADSLNIGSGHGPVHHFHRFWNP